MRYQDRYLITHGFFFYYSFRDLWEVIRGDSLLQNRLWNPRYILELMGHLSPFPWSISSFEDHQDVIEGRSPPWNGLWHPWYILYKIWHILHKIWYILKKVWYIQSLNYRDPYLITYGLFIPLGTFGK